MRISKLAGTVALTAFLSSAAFAEPDLIGSQTKGNEVMQIELAFLNDDSVAGLQFDIQPAAGQSFKHADLSNCLAGLPGDFAGSTCALIDDKTIRVVIFSMDSARVPSGVLGTISVAPQTAKSSVSRSDLLSRSRGSSAGGANTVAFENVTFGGTDGTRIEPGLVGFSGDNQ